MPGVCARRNSVIPGTGRAVAYLCSDPRLGEPNGPRAPSQTASLRVLESAPEIGVTPGFLRVPGLLIRAIAWHSFRFSKECGRGSSAMALVLFHTRNVTNAAQGNFWRRWASTFLFLAAASWG